MEILETRFNNFKAFCHKIKPENEFVKMLQNTSLSLFLQTIKLKQQQNASIDEIMKMILEKAEIDPEKESKEDLEKLKRYIHYFDETLKALE